jgi:hypothetical protein
MSKWIVVDVESDGPVPGKYSMVSFGAVIVEPGLTKTFFGQTKPVSEEWNDEALSISGVSREEHMSYRDPAEVMKEFAEWISENAKSRPVFVSDNNGFDWQWINYYFHVYYGSNPFGWTSRRISDLFCGMKMDTYAKWKHLRKTVHDHNPVNDAIGNAEALLEMKRRGLNIPIK